MASTDLYNSCLKLAMRSTCLRTKFGSIIVKNTNDIIGRGYNKPLLECSECPREKLNIHHGDRLELCTAIHSEQMALLDSLQKHNSVRNCDLYILGIHPSGNFLCKSKMDFYCTVCCTVCARLLLFAGIRKIYGFTENGTDSVSPLEALKQALSVRGV